MSEAVLMKGNEALAEAALTAGCRAYFGYPITPQNEVPELMSRRLPELGGVFIQAESETAAISMVMGASASGARVMTSSSSPGVSLKQEGISYLAGCRLPAVIVNIMRAGPGLGDITPAQSDYFQSTRGGGHGDYRTFTFLPGNVQELADMTIKAFDLADEFRTPVLIAADAMIGQMSEAVRLPKAQPKEFEKPWALTGAKGREKNIVRSLWLYPDKEVENNNYRLAEGYKKMQALAEHDTYNMENAEYLLVAYGTMARICQEAVDKLEDEGVKVGLFRPKTGFPYPANELKKAAADKKFILTVEMSMGQMVEDVKLSLENEGKSVHFYGRPGGGVPTVSQVVQAFKNYL